MWQFLTTNRRRIGIVLMCYVALLVVGTHLPQDQLADFTDQDKAIHVVAYTGLAILVFAYSVVRWDLTRTRVVGIIVGLLLFAALDEFTQSFIAGRDADIRDWTADSAGIALAAIGWYAVKRGASEDFPESADPQVNSWGSERGTHPRRST